MAGQCGLSEVLCTHLCFRPFFLGVWSGLLCRFLQTTCSSCSSSCSSGCFWLRTSCSSFQRLLLKSRLEYLIEPVFFVSNDFLSLNFKFLLSFSFKLLVLFLSMIVSKLDHEDEEISCVLDIHVLLKDL
ncbi:unnamed protein product [Moneuplotes crassus]|uniref:Uncharacterized protein n=1 Tax=Euplotes crassus TaxID=5936 RepID=A0AAD2D724_EUPCR|nr:unnamed protein product [Moneuplotes crassus]